MSRLLNTKLTDWMIVAAVILFVIAIFFPISAAAHHNGYNHNPMHSQQWGYHSGCGWGNGRCANYWGYKSYKHSDNTALKMQGLNILGTMILKHMETNRPVIVEHIHTSCDSLPSAGERAACNQGRSNRMADEQRMRENEAYNRGYGR